MAVPTKEKKKKQWRFIDGIPMFGHHFSQRKNYLNLPVFLDFGTNHHMYRIRTKCPGFYELVTPSLLHTFQIYLRYTIVFVHTLWMYSLTMCQFNANCTNIVFVIFNLVHRMIYRFVYSNFNRIGLIQWPSVELVYWKLQFNNGKMCLVIPISMWANIFLHINYPVTVWHILFLAFEMINICQMMLICENNRICYNYPMLISQCDINSKQQIIRFKQFFFQ